MVFATIICATFITSRQSRNTFFYIVGVCIAFSLLRLALIALTTHTQNSPFAMPRITVPHWAGGFDLGGKVDTEVLISSAQSMTILTCVIIACCGFSFLVGPHRMIHLIPRKLRAMRESTHITSNVLWRAPNEIRLINEAHYNNKSTTKFSTLKHIFPTFVSELVNQSTTHAGVVDLRKAAITRGARWHQFTFSRYDMDLIGVSIAFVVIFVGIFMAF